MATELAKAYVQIIPSAKGIKGSITEVLGGEAERAGESSGRGFANTFKKAVAAAGIGAAFKKSIFEGADLQQSWGGIETLFKESAWTVAQNAAQAYKTAGMSANEYMEMTTGFAASLLQGLSGDTAKAADIADMAMTDMADNSNKMGAAMEDIQNAYQGFAKQNYTMLDNLKLGYGGTKTEMERLLADAQELTGVEYNIDNLADVYSAIHAIQENLEITGTTALEAETTFTGSFNSMKAAALNLAAGLSTGLDIQPMLSALNSTVYTFLVGNLIPMVGNVLRQAPTLLSGAMNILVRGLNIASSHASEILQFALDIVKGLATGIIGNLPFIAEAAWNLVVSFGAALLDTDWRQVASDFITSISEAINAAIDQIFGENNSIVNAFRDIFSGLGSIAKEHVEPVMSTIQGAFDRVRDAAAPLADTVTSLKDKFLEYVESGGLVEDVLGAAGAAADLLSGALAVIADAVATVIEAGAAFITWLTSGSDGAQQLIAAVVAVTVGFVAFKAALMIGSAISAVQTALSTIPAVLTGVKTAVIGVNTALMANPIALAVAAIAALVAGFAYLWNTCDGFREFWTGVWESIKAAASAVVEWFSSLPETLAGIWDTISGKVGEAWEGITSTISNAVSSAYEAASGKFEEIRSAVSEKVSSAYEAVSGKFESIKGAISTKLASACSTVSGKFESVRSTISTKLTSAYSTVSDKFESIRSTVANKLSSAYSTVSGKFESIRSTVANKLSSAYFTVSGKFESIKSAMSDKLSAARDTVGNLIEAIKGKFNFSWSLPKLKLPHISISGSFSLMPPSVPKFSISWYRKAMNNAMLLNGATIFGVSGNTFLGGGEAGPEVVAGANTLMNMIRSATGADYRNTAGADRCEQLLEKIITLLTLLLESGAGATIIINGADYRSKRELAEAIAELLGRDVARKVAAHG